MRFLLDTNILIKLEPGATDDLEPDAPEAAGFLRLANSGDHGIFVHEAIRYDIARDPDEERRARHDFVFSKYPLLPYPPSASQIYQSLGEPAEGTNDWVDFQLAAAAASGAVAYVVTEDAALVRRMRRIGLGDRALRLADAVDLLESLYDHPVPPPPVVTETKMYTLDQSEAIWNSFRSEYDEFDAWWERAAPDARPAWFVGSDDGYLAVTIAKPESESRHGLQGRVLKVCSFKVAEEAHGSKLGELLLKTLFRFAGANGYDVMYVEVFGHHDDVVLLFEDFGFREQPGISTSRGEIVLVKRLNSPATVPTELSEIEFHIRFGPPALHPSARLFLVPIRPSYHQLLFPDLEDRFRIQSSQAPLPGLEPVAEPPGPYGNALKKAYLSHANTRRITDGSGLVFYRSGDVSAATTLGVVESTLVSDDPNEIAAYVGPRTVYTFDQITEMTDDGEVLSILFRHDQSFEPIGLAELVENSAIRGAPQSISLVDSEGEQWLKGRIVP